MNKHPGIKDYVEKVHEGKLLPPQSFTFEVQGREVEVKLHLTGWGDANFIHGWPQEYNFRHDVPIRRLAQGEIKSKSPEEDEQ